LIARDEIAIIFSQSRPYLLPLRATTFCQELHGGTAMNLREHALADDERLADSVPDAAKRLGVSQSFIWAEIAAGCLPSYKIGKRRLISRIDQQRYFEIHRVRP
jgi:excisionase family DNA binding protein